MSRARGSRTGVETAREFAQMALAGFVPDLRQDLGQRLRFRPMLDLTGEQQGALRLIEDALRHAPLVAQQHAWGALEGLLDRAACRRDPRRESGAG